MRYLISLFFIICNCCLAAQPGSGISKGIPISVLLYKEKNLYGYKSGDSTVIEALYDKIDQPYSGFMLARKDGRFGAIDGKGATLLPFVYTHLSRPHSKKFRVLLASRAGQEGFGFIDTSGQVILPFEWQRALWYSDSLIYLSKTGLQRILNYRLETVVETHYDEWDLEGFRVNRSRHILARNHGKWGIISPQNKVLAPFEYDQIVWVKGNFAGVKKDNKMEVVNLINQHNIIDGYEAVDEPDGNGLMQVEHSGLYGMIDTFGAVVLNVQYAACSGIPGMAFIAVQAPGGAWAVFGSSGRPVTGFKYLSVTGIYADNFPTVKLPVGRNWAARATLPDGKEVWVDDGGGEW